MQQTQFSSALTCAISTVPARSSFCGLFYFFVLYSKKSQSWSSLPIQMTVAVE